MPVVKDLESVDLISSEFEAIGYEYLGEFGIIGRRYLRKGGEKRTHQVHIFAQSDRTNIERHLAFRDYLCSHEDTKAAYAKLKSELAKKYPYDLSLIHIWQLVQAIRMGKALVKQAGANGGKEGRT